MLGGLRDRALLLLGFAGGFRRSELIALAAADLKFVTEGLEAFVASSKTDQERRGHTKMVAYGSDPATCPAVIVKRTAWKAGLPTPQLSDHSLRAGFVTEAAKNGADYLGLPRFNGQVY